MQQLERNMHHLERNMERLEANLERLQRDVARYVRIGARQILSLREAQVRTEARLDRLVETVDKLSLRLEEVADKLDGLIGYVNGLGRPGGPLPSGSGSPP
jgi:predicted RNase H-like nuclease (RuvC/YqgF family)